MQREKYFRIALLVFSLLAAGTQRVLPQSAGQAVNTRTVTLDEFVEKSCRANPSFRKILHDSLYLRFSEDLGLSPGNYTVSADLGYYYRPDSERTGAGSSMDITKLFPETGTTARAAWEFGPGAIDPSSAITFSIYQDIAENAFGKSHSLAGIGIAARKRISEYQITEAYEELLAVLIQEYYSWVSDFKNLKTAESSMREGLRLLENTEKRQASMIASPLDLNQMRLTVLDRKESLMEAQSAFEKGARKISDFMRERPSAAIVPEAANVSLELESDFDKAFEKSALKSRTFIILEELEKEGLNSVEIKKRALLPSAELFASYSRGGTGYLPGGVTERSLSVGIRAGYDFPDKRKKAELETASLDYRKTLLGNEISRESLRFELYEIHTRMRETAAMLELYEEKKTAAELVLKGEEREFSIGRGTLKSYTDAVKSLDSIRYSIEDLRARLNTYRIEWLRLTDSLVSGKPADLIK